MNLPHTFSNYILDNYSNLKTTRGLLGGFPGQTLFSGYAFTFLQSIEEAKLDSYIDEVILSIEEFEYDCTLSNGLAGDAFILQHFRNTGILDNTEENPLSDIDDLLFSAIKNYIDVKNWDPLHGYIGMGLYILERHKENPQFEILNAIIDGLEQNRESHLGYQLWVTPYNPINKVKANFNFGLAHGISGIVSFVSQVAGLGVKKDKCLQMVDEALRFFLQYEIKNDPEIYNLFPSNIIIEDGTVHKYGRLAWCYGDLNVAIAFMHAAKAFDRPDWLIEGIRIAKNSTLRERKTSGVKDPMFCHGAVGVMHIYHRFWLATKDEIFLNARESWRKVLIEEYFIPNEGICGFRTEWYDEKIESYYKVDQSGLLEGTAGVALTIMCIDQNIEPSWDIIFQTNF